MKILIVKTSSMGDIIDTLPSLTDALEVSPSIRFDWVVEEAFAQIPSWHKAVDRVISVAIRRWRRAWFSSIIKAERKAFLETVRDVKYDAIIDAQGLLKSAVLVTRLVDGLKHGMDWKSVREPLSSFFYNCRHFVSKRQHAVERTRELFAKSLGYSKPNTKGDFSILKNFLNFTMHQKNSYLVFIHSSTSVKKQWPESNWRQLIGLLGVFKYRIKLLWGISHEKERANRLSEGFDYVEVLPYTSLYGVVKQLIGAQAIVSVDTGLSHLAAALGCPNITLYGPTNPVLIGSYGENQYICSPKYSSRLKDLSVDMVFSQLKILLGERQSLSIF